MIMEILQYIRSLFAPYPTKRKRSCSEEDFHVPIVSKLRKMSHKPGPEGTKYSRNSSQQYGSSNSSSNYGSFTIPDEWLKPTKPLNLFHRKTSNSNDPILKSVKLRPDSPIVIEDDVEIIDFKNLNGKSQRHPHHYSTPKSDFKENGFDFTLGGKLSAEITRRNSLKENGFDFGSDKKIDFHRKSFIPALRPDKIDLTHSQNSSAYFTPGMRSLSTSTDSKESGKRQKSPAMCRKTKLGSALNDFTFRLDEKRRYEELLRKSAGTSAGIWDSFAGCSMPNSSQRSRSIIDLALNHSSRHSQDGSAKGHKTATSQKIQEVLDKFSSDVVVVKDSDSDDVEVVSVTRRSPPSPKPDIQVDRVNSLKDTIVDFEPLEENWIQEKNRKHREELNVMQKEIEMRRKNLLEFRKINDDMLRSNLSKDVQNCMKIREIVIAIDEEPSLPELTDEHLSMVEKAFTKSRSMNEVLSSKFNLNITRRDMHTLAGLNWLNDEVINFYMNLLIERGKLENNPRVYAFNTFFYPKILRDGQPGVRRWTRLFDLFSYDMICVPIHLGMHWCMAVIDIRNKCISYYDSMGKPNHQCTEALLKYLRDEHKDKKGSELDTHDWKLQCPKNIPQQMNGSDCGMFSCTYAEFQTRKAEFSFSQEDMPYFRKKMVVEIMLGHLLIT